MESLCLESRGLISLLAISDTSERDHFGSILFLGLIGGTLLQIHTCQTHIPLPQEHFSVSLKCKMHHMQSAEMFCKPVIHTKWMSNSHNSKLHLITFTFLL